MYCAQHMCYSEVLAKCQSILFYMTVFCTQLRNEKENKENEKLTNELTSLACDFCHRCGKY